MLGFGLYLSISGVYFSSALLTIGAIILTPALMEIFAYAYRSPQLWEWNENEESETNSNYEE